MERARLPGSQGAMTIAPACDREGSDVDSLRPFKEFTRSCSSGQYAYSWFLRIALGTELVPICSIFAQMH